MNSDQLPKFEFHGQHAVHNATLSSMSLEELTNRVRSFVDPDQEYDYLCYKHYMYHIQIQAHEISLIFLLAGCAIAIFDQESTIPMNQIVIVFGSLLVMFICWGMTSFQTQFRSAVDAIHLTCVGMLFANVTWLSLVYPSSFDHKSYVVLFVVVLFTLHTFGVVRWFYTSVLLWTSFIVYYVVAWLVASKAKIDPSTFIMHLYALICFTLSARRAEVDRRERFLLLLEKLSTSHKEETQKADQPPPSSPQIQRTPSAVSLFLQRIGSAAQHGPHFHSVPTENPEETMAQINPRPSIDGAPLSNPILPRYWSSNTLTASLPKDIEPSGFMYWTSPRDSRNTQKDISHLPSHRTLPELEPQNEEQSSEIVDVTELPQWYAFYTYIPNGYRLNYSIKESLLSAFHFHNETTNIWTEIVPGIILDIVLLRWLIASPCFFTRASTLSKTLVLPCSIMSAIRPYISAYAHATYCVSPRQYLFAWTCDQMSVVAYVFAMGLMHVHMCLYFYTTAQYVAIFVLICTVFIAQVHTFFASSRGNIDLANTLSGIVILVCITPLFGSIVVWALAPDRMPLRIMVLMQLVYIALFTGVAFKMTGLPEKWLNGKIKDGDESSGGNCNANVFPSHSVWHVFVWIATFLDVLTWHEYLSHVC